MEITSVRDSLVQWYEKHCKNGNLAWSYVERKSGVSASNICKIANGKIASPKYETAKSLLTTIYPMNNAEVYRFLIEMYPKKAIHLEGFMQEKRNRIADSSFHLLRDSLSFRLFKLATAGTIKIKDLHKEFGETPVEERLPILINANLLRVSDDGHLDRSDATVFTANGDVNWIAEEFIHSITILSGKKLMSQESEKEIDTRINKFLYYHGSFTDEAIAQIGEEVSTFINQLYKKFSQEKYKGNIPVFINLACGRFDSK